MERGKNCAVPLVVLMAKVWRRVAKVTGGMRLPRLFCR